MNQLSLSAFTVKHCDALFANQARNNLMLGLLDRANLQNLPLNLWSFGDGANCAIQNPGRAVILGDLSKDSITQFSSVLLTHDFAGIYGYDGQAEELVGHLSNCGIKHKIAMKQIIHQLDGEPKFPNSPGSSRLAQDADLDVLTQWTSEFIQEAAPHATVTPRGKLLEQIREERIFFWEVDGEFVAMAARLRETRDGANIGGVYVPARFRGHSYGGAVTAAVCNAIVNSGKSLSFLSTDETNPTSNRLYRNIGFIPVARATEYLRVLEPTSQG